MTAPRRIIVAAALLLACSSSSNPPPPTYSTADLAGQWHFAMVLDGVGVAAGTTIGWRRGVATIDASGVVNVTQTLDSMGNTTPVSPAPVLSVDANGVVTGTIANVTDFNGQLSRGKDLRRGASGPGATSRSPPAGRSTSPTSWTARATPRSRLRSRWC